MPVLEDAAYEALRFDGEAVPAIAALDDSKNAAASNAAA